MQPVTVMKRSQYIRKIVLGRARSQLRTSLFRLCILVLAGIIVSPVPLWAQRIPTSGPFKAMVVFVRFQDDVDVYNGCTPANWAWSQPDVLPSFAHGLLASSPAPPFPESSLTAYFYQQSQGRFTLYGDVYPRVLVTEQNETFYRLGSGRRLKLAVLTKELLDRIDADSAFDLGAYDANTDGYVDHIFFVLRKPNHLELARGNASGIGLIGYSSSEPEFGNDSLSLKKVHPTFSGSYVRYNWSGNIIPEVNLARLMAHEFGHDLWSNSVLRGKHVNASNKIGYVLMAGRMGGLDMRGDETISAFERDLLRDGWITCPMLTTEGRYSLTDLYSDNTANCYKLLMPVASFTPRTVYLTNRQRVGPFDRLRTNSCTDPPNEHGLKTTGLLVTVAWHDRLEVLPADNTLELSIESRPYAGDMYGPETAIQVTPWTVPNINGYTAYPEDLELEAGNFQAIDNIRYTGEANGEMAFDYIKDFRERPIIREDSWMGAETAGYDFESDVTVRDSSVLTINTALHFSSALRIEGGSTVVIDAEGDVVLKGGSTLDMADHTRLVVRGKLSLNGSVYRGSDAEIVFESQGEVEGHVPLSVSRPSDDGVSATASYPNPFNTHTTITYDLPRPAFVTLRIYDVLGREVETLVEEQQYPGRHDVVFDGAGLPGGVYFYRIEVGQSSRTGKMIRLR